MKQKSNSIFNFLFIKIVIEMTPEYIKRQDGVGGGVAKSLENLKSQSEFKCLKVASVLSDNAK